MKPFDIPDSPLTGTHLIEASAGTGKTYAIESLFVRLILEKHLSVDQILVVTFTKAATDELKDRLRKKLLQTQTALAKSQRQDPLIAQLIKRQNNPALARQLIHEALINFDRAAIFTIHGFCQRILYENAFETGSLFDTEIITDQTDLIQEITDDFWRKHFYRAPLEFISYVSREITGPEYFLELFCRVKAFEIKIVPQRVDPSLENIKPYRTAYHRLKSAWTSTRETVMEALRSPALSGTIYGSLKREGPASNMTKRELKIISLIESMDRMTDSQNTGFPLFKNFEKFTATHLSRSVRKNQTPPSHEFFMICDDVFRKSEALKAEMDRYVLYLKTRLFDFVDPELMTRKTKRNCYYFDDLLIMVKNALAGDRGKVLAETIRQKYRAALVDEFQDTDNWQYDIFTRLFSTPENLLLMIGDPKQAIYGFRGADVFSYMKASRNAGSKFTLTKNWRSEPGLITAVNTLFSNVNRPFVFDEITFELGQPGNEIPTAAENAGASLIVWWLDPKKIFGEEKIIGKTEALPLIADAVAEEIRRLISPGPACVETGDIAVLVRTNKQAQIIKSHLSAKGIPSVLYSTGNIFDAPEAAEMEKILSAIAEPENIAGLRSACVMDMMGISGDELHDVEKNPLWWEMRLTNFNDYHQMWNRHGFIRMFRMFLANENIKERLLSFPDGERRLTNVLHLAEIFHQVSIEKKLGMHGLLKWLAEKRNPASPRIEEYQLRLESDEYAVKIVTIHKSKGLEYPVVFCPFGWEGSAISAKEVVFHDVDADMQLTFDLGTEARSRHLKYAQNELLAENLRLFYVAVTRAKTRCYLAWGRINTAETSAMAYLFHHWNQNGSSTAADNIVDETKKIFAARSDDELIADLHRLVRKSNGSIEVAPLPTASDLAYRPPRNKTESFTCRKFSGKIDRRWRISSYSSLVSSHGADADLPDHDIYPGVAGLPLDQMPDDASLYRPDASLDIFSFPKGARSGIFFHDIFQHIDFQEKSQATVRQLVVQKMQDYGFDHMWLTPVLDAVVKVLNTNLSADGQKFTLADIPMSDRINEMEFYFPLNPISPPTLQRLFRENREPGLPAEYPDRMGNLDFSAAVGFMKGYIDMVFRHAEKFYLVDWKSNYLGSGAAHYTVEHLNKTMVENFYILQYHLYTLALYQYLKWRHPDFKYETDFGGVFYIFIRGVDDTPGAKSGILWDRPGLNLIKALGEVLIPGFNSTAELS